MHLITAELVDIYCEGTVRMGRVRVGGAYSRVTLTLVPEARTGDRLLIHAGVALARENREDDHVSGDPGQDPCP